MQIDWTTFALEIVNFLALVWLLKRYLYAPVLDILAQRRAGVERVLADAHATEQRAQALQGEFERRLADWDNERAAARLRLQAELAEARAQGLRALAATLADERERSVAIDALRRQQTERACASAAMAQAQRFTATLLERVADPAIDARLLERFLEEWAALPDDELRRLRLAAADPGTVAQVMSAFPLDESQRERLRAALAERLAHDVAVHFADDRQLLAGLRVSLGAWHLHLNFADELACFAAASNHAE